MSKLTHKVPKSDSQLFMWKNPLFFDFFFFIAKNQFWNTIFVIGFSNINFQTLSSDLKTHLILYPCHQNLITQISKLGTVMIKYRVQYVEKCNQKQRFWFGFCEKEILSNLSNFFSRQKLIQKE